MIRKNEQSIGEVIRLALKKFQLEDKLTEIKINAAWEKVMGNQICRFTNKVVFKGGILTIYLKSAPLREELSLAKSKIIKSLNKNFENCPIKDLMFR